MLDPGNCGARCPRFIGHGHEQGWILGRGSQYWPSQQLLVADQDRRTLAADINSPWAQQIERKAPLARERVPHSTGDGDSLVDGRPRLLAHDYYRIVVLGGPRNRLDGSDQQRFARARERGRPERIRCIGPPANRSFGKDENPLPGRHRNVLQALLDAEFRQCIGSLPPVNPDRLGFRAKCGHLCFKFSPVEVANGSRFNPLAEVRIGTPRDVSDAQNVADMIVRTGEDSPQERYWQDAAASITTGMVLHVCYAAAASGRVACLADLSAVFTRPGQTFRETLAELESFPHDPEYEHKWRTGEDERTATHPVVREKAREMLDKEDKDFSGVLSTAKTALTLYSDPLVARNTSASDFRIADLVNHAAPVSLYLVVPPSDKIRLRPLIRLIFTMIVNRLTERMDFEGVAQKRNRYRLLFMIDEFPSLKRMEVFADALSYMAGYGLKAYLITQDIRQIVDEYGPNESIVSNCHVRIAYAPNQYDTAELLSKMTGTKTVQKATYNFSGSRLAPIANHMSATVDQVERPLVTPDEVMRLRPPKKAGHGAAERIVAPGDMLIFVSGHYPIYGTQILYFTDPALAKRAVLPPPSAFFAIEEGSVIQQPDADRTRNVISAPEPRKPVHSVNSEPTAAMSPMEKAFLKELGDSPGTPSSTGFVEQLDLDLHEAEIQ